MQVCVYREVQTSPKFKVNFPAKKIATHFLNHHSFLNSSIIEGEKTVLGCGNAYARA